MTHRNRPQGARAGRSASSSRSSNSTWLPPGRECPWCASRDTGFVQRGFAGGQSSKDQYILCNDCERATYDIVATTDRDVRINRYQNGGEFRDPKHRTKYKIYRMLKVGFNEYLLYVRPVLPEPNVHE